MKLLFLFVHSHILTNLKPIIYDRFIKKTNNWILGNQ